MNLDVPLYTQSSDFSCGSACVAMILKYYNFVSNLDRDLEIELWRETNAALRPFRRGAWAGHRRRSDIHRPWSTARSAPASGW